MDDMMNKRSVLSEDSFDSGKQHHKETIFTIGNGYLSTRGAFEEGYPGDHRATFVHGVFDDVPITFTELANIPDWLPLIVVLDGERFSMDTGTIESYQRQLDLQTGILTRTIRWCSPAGLTATLIFERFASLADEHVLCLRCKVIPEYDGTLEIRAALDSNIDNRGIAHWRWVKQGLLHETVSGKDIVYLQTQTRATGADLALSMRLETDQKDSQPHFWDAQGVPTLSVTVPARNGEAITVDKFVGIAASRDTDDPVSMAVKHAGAIQNWDLAFEAHKAAWDREWARCDIQIEGDDKAHTAVRFSMFQLLIAAPRNDNRVNIGAKTLSGLGYAGHCFWDTEIFMLPFFIYTAPHIARNLLDYRYQRLPAARKKAQDNGFDGAQFPWESADTGEEVTPTWVPHFGDRTKLVRIWTGDIEIHISADIAYSVVLFWKVTNDDAWFADRGAEIVLEAARFWESRAEWNSSENRYEFTDVIGPDEYHDHIDNNAFTNYMARWNLQAGLEVLEWLKVHAPGKAEELALRLGLNADLLARWQEVVSHIYLPIRANGLIEQFEGYFQRRDVELASLEPRHISAQVLFGIEGCNETQVIKQPDVLMLQYLLRGDFTDEQVRTNYDYYTPRTDHTYGSSLGPSIQAIMACEVEKPEDAYEHFIRAAQADLLDVRGNAGDGIHGASAGGIWQAVVFGFAGLQVSEDGWTVRPRLPRHWRRLAFKFFHRGELQTVELTNPANAPETV